MTDYSKDFFQRSWGDDGYYENFSYGVGIDKVCEVCLIPFRGLDKQVLEIGSGGGVFTERIIKLFGWTTAIDVIEKPDKFIGWRYLTYVELPEYSYNCALLPSGYFDFCFSYNTFCHLSNEALKEYLSNIHRVLKQGADFVFMLSNYENGEQYTGFNRGDLLPHGHFYQDKETLNLIADLNQWEVVSENMIPKHRDIIVHLKKK